jgi:hypothetical protein
MAIQSKESPMNASDSEADDCPLHFYSNVSLNQHAVGIAIIINKQDDVGHC